MKKKLDYQDITAAIDTREQKPLSLSPLKTAVKTLKTGDYSVVGRESEITVEVKALDDFIGCTTWERERFERELERMRSYPWKLIVIKSNWSTIALKQYRSQVVPNVVMGSAMKFAGCYNVSIMMAESHDMAGWMVARFLYVAANALHLADFGKSCQNSSSGVI